MQTPTASSGTMNIVPNANIVPHIVPQGQTDEKGKDGTMERYSDILYREKERKERDIERAQGGTEEKLFQYRSKGGNQIDGTIFPAGTMNIVPNAIETLPLPVKPEQPPKPVKQPSPEARDDPMVLIEEGEREEARQRSYFKDWAPIEGLIADCDEAQRLDQPWGPYQVHTYLGRRYPNAGTLERLADDEAGFVKKIHLIARGRCLKAKQAKEAPR